MASEAGAVAAASSTPVALQQLDLDYEVATFKQLTEVVEGPLSALCGQFKQHALELSGMKKHVEGLNITGLQFEEERAVIFATPAHGRQAMFLHVTTHLGNIVRALEIYKTVSDYVPSIEETLEKMEAMSTRLGTIEDTAKTELVALADRVTLIQERLKNLQTKLGDGLIKGGELYQTAEWIKTYMQSIKSPTLGQSVDNALLNLEGIKAEKGPFEVTERVLPKKVTLPLNVEGESANSIYDACQNAFNFIYGRGIQHLTLLGVARKDLQQGQEINTSIQFLEMDEEKRVSLQEAPLAEHLTRLLAYIGFAKDEDRQKSYSSLLKELEAAHTKLEVLDGYEEKAKRLERQIGLLTAMISSFNKELHGRNNTYELARSFYGIAHPNAMRGIISSSVPDEVLEAAIAKAMREYNEVNEEESA